MAVSAFEMTVLLLLAHHGVGYLGNLFTFLLYKLSLFADRKLIKRWPDEALVYKALKQYAVETLIVFPLLGYFVVSPVLLTRAAAELPPWYVVVAQLVVIFLSTDFLFYWAHRILHWPPLYKRIHKQHHEFTVTTSITFEYSHPVETLTNLLSVTIPPLVLGTHPFVTAASLGLRMWESVDCHCGYELPYWLSPWQIIRRTARHNFHHSKNQGSYGITAIFDILFGTDGAYNEHMKKQEK